METEAVQGYICNPVTPGDARVLAAVETEAVQGYICNNPDAYS